MTKWQARIALVAIAAVLLIPASFVHIHGTSSLLWAGHHCTLLAFLTAVIAATAIVLAGGVLVLLTAMGIWELIRIATK